MSALLCVISYIYLFEILAMNVSSNTRSVVSEYISSFLKSSWNILLSYSDFLQP